jgi:hypothetical protein
MMVETAAEQRTSEHVPPEERRVLEPRQEAPEQSAAMPSTQEGVLPNAAAQGKTPVVLSKPGSSRGYANTGASQRQEEAKADQEQEQPRTVDATESDDDILEEI